MRVEVNRRGNLKVRAGHVLLPSFGSEDSWHHDGNLSGLVDKEPRWAEFLAAWK